MIMDKLDNPPPEKILSMPKNWLLDRNLSRAVASMLGIGIADNNLNIIKASNTKITLLRKVASIQINFILLQKFFILMNNNSATF